MTELKNALATNDMTQVKAKSDALQKVLQEVGTKVYQQAASEYAKQKGQQQPGQGPEAGAGPQMPPTDGSKVQVPKNLAKRKLQIQKTTK